MQLHILSWYVITSTCIIMVVLSSHFTSGMQGRGELPRYKIPSVTFYYLNVDMFKFFVSFLWFALILNLKVLFVMSDIYFLFPVKMHTRCLWGPTWISETKWVYIARDMICLGTVLAVMPHTVLPRHNVACAFQLRRCSTIYSGWILIKVLHPFN